jgi:hypothetical protein
MLAELFEIIEDMAAAYASGIVSANKGSILVYRETAQGTSILAHAASADVDAKITALIPYVAQSSVKRVAFMGARPTARVALALWNAGIRRIVRPDGSNVLSAAAHNAVEAEWVSRGGSINTFADLT